MEEVPSGSGELYDSYGIKVELADAELDDTNHTIQHLVHVMGSDVEIDINVRGLIFNSKNNSDIAYNVYLSIPGATTLLGLLGYSDEDITLKTYEQETSELVDNTDEITQCEAEVTTRNSFVTPDIPVPDYVTINKRHNDSITTGPQTIPHVNLENETVHAHEDVDPIQGSQERSVDLTTSIQTLTGDNKSFRCEICGYDAVYKSTYILHKRTHSGDRPHKCPLCHKGFGRKHAVKVHMRGFHKLDEHQQLLMELNNDEFQGDTTDEKLSAGNVCTNEIQYDDNTSKQMEMQIEHGNVEASSQEVENEVTYDTNDQLVIRDDSDGDEKTKETIDETVQEFNQPTTSRRDDNVSKHSETVVSKVNPEQTIPSELHHCPLCETKCKDKQELYAHMNTVHNIGNKKIRRVPDEPPTKRSKQEESNARQELLELPKFKNISPQGNYKQLLFMSKLDDTKLVERELGEHVCEECGYAAKFKSQLTKHKRIHAPDRPYKCTECDKDFKRNYKLTVHMREAHEIEQIVPVKLRICDICGYDAKFPYQVLIHKKSHTHDRPYSCSMCDKTFKRRDHQNKHMKKKHGIRHAPISELDDSTEEGTSAHCARSADGGKSNILHQSDQKGTVGLIKPHTDTEKLHTEQKIHTGEETIHKEEDQIRTADDHPIHTNDEQTETADTIHTGKRKIHTGVNKMHKGETFSCAYCGSTFTTSEHLLIHIRCKHTSVKPYSCKYCDSTFRSPMSLKAHVALSHTPNKSIKCNVCHIRFTNSSGLSMHKRIHDNNKRFICTICGYASVQKSNHKIHMIKHGLKPFSCLYCPHKCKTKYNMEKHQRTHTEERGSVDAA